MLGAVQFGDKFDKVLEMLVLELRDMMVKDFMPRGYDIIIDDTNFHPRHEKRMRSLAQERNNLLDITPGEHEHYEVEVKFFDVSVKTAIKRDLARAQSVGSEVIERMYNDFLTPKADVYSPKPGLPACIIVDIDGTLAHMTNRGPFDTSKYDDDTFDEIIADVARAERHKGVAVVLCSGREEAHREVTEGWLKRHGFEWDAFFMRCTGDNRNDAIIKSELFDENIKDKWQVKFVLDDRDRVVKMWRERGLKVLQVAEGNF